MESSTEPKVPPYQPHQDYVAQHNQQFHKPFPSLPTDAITPVAPLPPAYNGRPYYIHDTTRLTIPQTQPHFNEPSPTYSSRSGKSSRLAVQSWLPAPFYMPMPEPDDALRSHFSQTSFLGDIPFTFRVRIFIMRWIVEWWLMEIISWTFSALCMITIIGVLFAYDGNELPEWPLGLTLNGFISALSASAKAALLLPTAEALGQLKWNWFSTESRSLIDFEVLDQASRGPMGSVLLLFKAMRDKGLNLAALGAVVVILCLPLDLFFQQIVTYQPAFLNMPMNSTLVRTSTYQSSGPVKVNGVEGIFADDAMASVVLPFFYGNGTVSPPKSYCPTANCTWTPFETLAVCSMCQPVPNLLEYGCHDGPAPWLTSVSQYGNSSTWPNATQCGWYLNRTDPDTRVLMTGYVEDLETGQRENLETRIFPLVDVFTFAPYYGGSVHFRSTFPDSILDAIIVSWPDDAGLISSDTIPRADECALTWCTQTLQSGASWSGVDENITESYFRDQSRLQYPWFINEDSGELYYNNNISMTPRMQHTVTFENQAILGGPQVYGLSNVTAYQTGLVGQTVAPSFFTSKGDLTTYKNKLWNPDTRGAPTRDIARNPWTGAQSSDERFRQIAKAMTNVIRNGPSPTGSQEIILGTSWLQRTHVFIRWGWIILPLVLLLLSLLLLIGTVMKSTREESIVGIWKTSVIAILFNGIDESVQRSVGPNCRMTEARAKAREFTVKLVPE